MKDFEAGFTIAKRTIHNNPIKKHTANLMLFKQNLCNDIRIKLAHCIQALHDAEDMIDVSCVCSLLSDLVKELYEESIK